jgi:hypothetical protein
MSIQTQEQFPESSEKADLTAWYFNAYMRGRVKICIDIPIFTNFLNGIHPPDIHRIKQIHHYEQLKDYTYK